jgi:hypothetical protein
MSDIQYDERATVAHLACLCSEPSRAVEGDWVMLLEDAHSRPIALAFVGLVFDFESAPIARSSSILSAAGYEHSQAVTAKPWSATWQIITREVRSIR